MGRWSADHQHLTVGWTNTILETLNPFHVTDQRTTFSLAIIDQWTTYQLHFIEWWTSPTKLLAEKMNILAVEILLKVINNIYLFIPSNNNNRKNIDYFSKSNQIYTVVKIGKEK